MSNKRLAHILEAVTLKADICNGMIGWVVGDLLITNDSVEQVSTLRL